MLNIRFIFNAWVLMGKFKFYQIVLLLVLSLFSMSTYSTHIVGGVMNYRYIGNDNYEITLFVYRDYKRAQPGAYFDYPYARIRVWDGSNELVYGFLLNQVDSLNDQIIDPCATITPNEGIDWTKYLDTINLPPIPEDYTIYYQRCCRNNSIDNLTRDPFSDEITWGATYSITIPGGTNPLSNSSPVITNYPPVYICANKTIRYDHSAVDSDGDSLAYHLCTPFTGASIYDPVNDYTNEFPPFDTVQWKSPYSLSNVLGGVPLTIHPKTGILTGTPNTVGQFVVGVCVDEYRNGILLTRTIRDFQFNVVDCGLQVVSSFFAPSVVCNDFTVNFDNQSIGATTYKWDFGDGDTSTLQFPSHTYRDTGLYTVLLICNEGASCSSAYQKEISIQYKKIDAAFTIADSTCLNSGDSIQFIDNSTDSFNVVSWQWNLPDNQQSTERNPIILYDGFSSSITAALTVTSVNGCTSNSKNTFAIYKQPEITLPNSILECKNATVQLPLIVEGNAIFSWSPSSGLNNPTLQQPMAILNSPITYYVTIKSILNNGDTCEKTDSIFLDIANPTIRIDRNIPVICNDSVYLSAVASDYQNIQWSDDRNFNTILSENLNLDAAQATYKKWYYARAIFNNCFDIDSILIESNPINLTTLNSAVCEGLPLALNIKVNSSSDYNLTWFINNDTIITENNSTLNIIPNASQTVYVKGTNIAGCYETDSFNIVVYDLPEVFASVDKSVIYKGEQITLEVNNGPSYTYQWLPANLLSNSTIQNPNSFPTSNTIFTVIVTDINECKNQDTVGVKVLDYDCSAKYIFIPNAFTPNFDGINDEFKVRSEILTKTHMEIYDRWGVKVFESDDINKGWNGTFKDQSLPGEIYGYYFSGECIQKEKLILKGNITLIR